MKKYYAIVIVLLVILALSCSQIPKNYNPPQYRKLAVIAPFPAEREINIGSAQEAMETIVEAVTYNYPEWSVTSELARISMRCGYDVYLLAPEAYFENRKVAVMVNHQKRYEGFMPDNYWDYVNQMKLLIGESMEPVVYLTGYQDAEDKNEFWLEMRRWDSDKKIFSMSYATFADRYDEFYCGADAEQEPTEKEETELKPDTDESDGSKGGRVK